MSQKKGFTLIELLVVIAIIAILAAILFPVFAKAREKARQVSCLSNLKQLGLAVMMYCEDYDETMPGYEDGAVNNAGWPSWQTVLFAYVQNGGVYGCPDGNDDQLIACPYFNSSSNYQVFKSNYAVNYAVMGANEGATLAAFVEPASTLLICDNSYDEGYNTLFNGANAPFNNTFAQVLGSNQSGGNAPTNGEMGFPHSNGVNIAFGDGHAKWMQWSAVPAFHATTDTTNYFWYPSGAAAW